MNNVTKLVVALLLGVAAATSNMVWLQKQKTPPMYVAAISNIKPGTLITDELLFPVPIPGDPAQIEKSFIPYNRRSVLFGDLAQRHYREGDMIMYRDKQLPAKKKRGFETIGPFRVVGVGGAFKETSADEKRIGAGGNNVTIAIGYDPDVDKQYGRLLKTIAHGIKITAVQVIPDADAELTKPEQESLKNRNNHQTISLAGLEHIPWDLYNGEVIRSFCHPHQVGELRIVHRSGKLSNGSTKRINHENLVQQRYRLEPNARRSTRQPHTIRTRRT